MFEACTWLNEPADWSADASELRVVTDAKTDFWRDTYYGFTRDTGHVLGQEVSGDFTAQVRIDAAFTDLYDQAGLVVRAGPGCWVKAGVELSDGQALFSSVLTVDRSDWAIGGVARQDAPFWVRATVMRGVLRLQVSSDGKRWPLLRLAPFPRAPTLFVGPMCCTPERAGLHVRFSEFKVGLPLGRDLHDLT